MRAINTWFLLAAMAFFASILPMSGLQSSEAAAFERDYGSCLINAGLSETALHIKVVEHNCDQRYKPSLIASHPWHSVSHCYDAYNNNGMSEAASMMIYRGCASYFDRT